MSSTDLWTDDGHVLVVEADGIAPEEGDVKVTVLCPPDGCKGPYIACERCHGAGTIEPPYQDEVDCADCKGTGWDGGVHQCWMATGYDDPRESLSDQHDDPWKLGRFRMSYCSDGWYDDFHVRIRRGDPLLDSSTTEETR